MGKSVVVPIIPTNKFCSQCGMCKSIDDFGKDTRATDRHKNECKPCRNIKEKTRIKTDEAKAKHRVRSLAYYRQNLKSKAVHLVSSARNRARGRNMNHTITSDYVHSLLQIGYCWATGLPFRYPGGNSTTRTPFSPSLDRRDTKQGYTPENTQLVCTMYNIGKAHHDELDFIAMCMAVAERNKNNQAAIKRLNELRNI